MLSTFLLIALGWFLLSFPGVAVVFILIKMILPDNKPSKKYMNKKRRK